MLVKTQDNTSEGTQMKKFAMIAAATASLLAVSALPANASFDGNIGDVNWSVNTSSSWGINQIGESNVNNAPDGPYALDGFWLEIEDPTSADDYLSLGCPANPSSFTVDGNDSLISCADMDTHVTGLDGTGEIRVFGGDYRNLVARVSYTLTNTTGTDMNRKFDFYFNTEECNNGVGNIATSSGDLPFTAEDTWMLCNNDNQAVEGAAFGPSWTTSIDYSGTNVSSDQFNVYNSSVLIPAGGSVTLVYYVYSIGALDHDQTFGVTDAAATTFMQNTFDPATIGSSHLWVGLDNAANWNGVGTAGGGNDLAETGTEPIGVLALGALFLATGVGIVARRRLTRR